MTDPRLAWLLEQLEADEATAKAAAKHARSPWRSAGDKESGGMVYAARRVRRDGMPGDGLWDDEGSSTLSTSHKVAPHIAIWDPARALAVVAALRQILEEHEPLVPWNRPGWTGCNNCEDGKQRLRPWPCPTVQAIAAIFADRPGFKEVWGDADEL